MRSLSCALNTGGVATDGRLARSCAALLMAFAMLLVLPAPAALAQIVPAPGPELTLPDFEALEPEGRNEIEIEEATSETTRSATVRVSTTVNDQVSRALRQATTGVPGGAASAEPRKRAGRTGGGGGAIAAWVNGGVTFLENETADLEFDGELYNPLTGVDYTILDLGLVAGIAVGYERSNLDTLNDNGSLDGDGFVISPYVGKTIGDFGIVDGGFGYVRTSYDRVIADPDGLTSTGGFDANRFFVFANATGYVPQELADVDGLTLLGKVGLRYSREDQDAFFQGTTRVNGRVVELGQLSIAGEARYRPEVDFEGIMEFFFRAEGNIDVIRNDAAAAPGLPQGSDDRTDVTVSLGAVATLTDTVSFDVTYEHVLSREDISEQSLVAGLRINF